jgi:ACS family tartrate transporter-like MFS transporter
MWLARIMITWGLLSAAMLFVSTPMQFYVLRFLLGVAEAGFFPGIIYYFSHWFPPSHRGRAVSRFYAASPLSSAVLGAVSGWMLGLDQHAGLQGWQWLFLLQGLPSVAVGLLLLRFLPERPTDVTWLTDAEKEWIETELAREQASLGPPRHHGMLAALRNPRVRQFGLLGALQIGSITTLVLSAPLILTAATGRSTGEVGRIVSLGGLIGAGVMLLAGGVADRRVARIPDALVYSVVLTMAYLLLALSSSAGVTVAAYLVFAAACFTVPMLVASGWSDVIPARELAVGGAAINTLAQVGAFVTPYAWGALRDATGGFRAGLFLLFAMGLAMSLLLAWICRRLRSPVVLAVQV